MIKPENIRKHLRIYCAVGLMISTILSLSELSRPSYALLTSTVQTSVTFSAAASIPEKEVHAPTEELTSSQTSVQLNNESAREQGTAVETSEQSGVQDGENQVKQEDQTLKTQSGVDNSEESPAR